jgi:hypothetical protein
MSQQSRADWTKAIATRELHASLEKRKNKYGATKVEVDGLVFDSKREAGRWRELVLMQAAGQITDLRRQEAFPLFAYVIGDGVWRRERTMATCVGQYVSDFSYVRDGRKVIEDSKTKATRTAVYMLKRKIVAANYGITIVET